MRSPVLPAGLGIAFRQSRRAFQGLQLELGKEEAFTKVKNASPNTACAILQVQLEFRAKAWPGFLQASFFL